MFPSDKTGRVYIQTYRLKIMVLLILCCKFQYECLTFAGILRDNPFCIIWFLVDRVVNCSPKCVTDCVAGQTFSASLCVLRK